MKTRLPRASVGLASSLTLFAALLGACAEDDTQRTEGLPAYCSTSSGGTDVDFWRLVEASCRVAHDGDVRQARALRHALNGLEAEQVAEFHRTFVRINHALYTEQVAAVADSACLPSIGLGNDLFTDFRSWVIAHGQAVYERVLASPETLNDFPDIASGCGMGEPFGYAANRVYESKAGRKALSRLPILEPATAPDA